MFYIDIQLNSVRYFDPDGILNSLKKYFSITIYLQLIVSHIIYQAIFKENSKTFTTFSALNKYYLQRTVRHDNLHL